VKLKAIETVLAGRREVIRLAVERLVGVQEGNNYLKLLSGAMRARV
jgi:hypothetical protein